MNADDLLRRIAAAPRKAGLFLDFDGVLAPIVSDPTTSAMTADLQPVLDRLAGALGVVAIISGRPAAFLAERAPVEGARLLGLYGTQEWREGRPVARPEAVEWESALDDARDAITASLVDHPGVVFEDKGLALAVHWRQAPDRDAAGEYVEALMSQIAADTGLASEPGKLVAELRPPLSWDKGTSVRSLVHSEGVELPVYAGDDRGDLAAFAAVRDAGGVALAVDHGAETHPDVREAADVMLDGTDAMAAWLTRLDAAL